MFTSNKTVLYIFSILLLVPLLGATFVSDEGKITSNSFQTTNFEAKALQYLEQNKEKYQLDNPRESFKLDRIRSDQFGLTHVRFQRYYDGVPIYGASIQVHQDSEGNLLSVSEEHIQFNNVIVTKPTIESSQAISIAKKNFTELKTNKQNEIEKIEATMPTLYVYDRSLFSDTVSNPKLVWKLIVGISNTPKQYVYYIDAQNGEVVHYLSTTAYARDRETYVLSAIPDCNTETLTYTELGLVDTYDVDADSVHQYAANAYDYYYNTFGRDSFDDEDVDDSTDGGGTIKSYTHYRDPDSCNDEFDAAWVSQSTAPYEFMYFAQGVYGQDIVGHEFTHGVVDYAADLEYENESGALDESYADIFGTMIEHYAGDNDWIIGEDLADNRAGCTTALRSLEDPTAYTGECDGNGSPLPDHYNGLVELAENELPSNDNDNGYVHTNSSITNYAFYLLSEGGTHPISAVSVTGIGESAAAQIYYQSLTNYLSINSDFQDAYTQTLAACLDLNTDDPTTYPLSYCDSVQQAFYAVGISSSASYVEAIAEITPASGYAPLTVNFDAADSFALNANIISYEWDLNSNLDSDGDGNALNDVDDTGPVASYTYNTIGSVNAWLTVTDSTGNTSEDVTTIVVENPITAIFSQTGDGVPAPATVSPTLQHQNQLLLAVRLNAEFDSIGVVS